MSTTLLNQENIIKKVYDPPTESLKVSGTSVVVPGQMEVALSAPDDSVAISDGVDTLAINSDGSLNVVTTPGLVISTPTIYNIPLTTAATEYTVAIPQSTQRFELRIRDGGAKAQFSFISGQSNTNFITLGYGSSYSEDGLSLSSILNIYIQSNKSNQVLEVITWN